MSARCLECGNEIGATAHVCPRQPEVPKTVIAAMNKSVSDTQRLTPPPYVLASPDEVCRVALLEGVEGMQLYRLLRGIFGLSLDEAKTVIHRGRGTPNVDGHLALAVETALALTQSDDPSQEVHEPSIPSSNEIETLLERFADWIMLNVREPVDHVLVCAVHSTLETLMLYREVEPTSKFVRLCSVSGIGDQLAATVECLHCARKDTYRVTPPQPHHEWARRFADDLAAFLEQHVHA